MQANFDFGNISNALPKKQQQTYKKQTNKQTKKNTKNSQAIILQLKFPQANLLTFIYIFFFFNKQIVYCQSLRPQRSCIISTNLDTMIRLIYIISILIIYMYTSYIYIWGNRLLVYEYNTHRDDKLIIQEAEHHMS
jgi:hypothetical protein